MPLSPLSHDIPRLTDQQVHQVTQQVLIDSFDDFEITGYRYSHHEVWDTLLYASAHGLSIHAACEAIEHAPSANWMYTQLNEHLLTTYSLEPLEQRGNHALQHAFPPRLNQRPQKIAIDLVMLPYYGDAATPGIRRSQAKKSTTKFFGYASAYLIKKHKRVTLAFSYVRPEDTLLEVLTRLLNRVAQLGIQLKRLYLDRGFAQVAILRFLQQQPFVSVVALPKRGERLKALQTGKQSRITAYTMRSPEHGEVTFPLWIACRYQKGKANKRGVSYLFFAVLGDCKSPILQVAEEYRHRFGVEASYRLMNAARATTTSRNPALRLLLVLLAFLLSNLWVWFKWNLWRISQRKRRTEPEQAPGGSFSLECFKRFLIEAIKERYGVVREIKL